MPSTFSPSLKLELIGSGEQAGVWGTTTNNNLGTLLEQAITGVITIDLSGYSTYTLTNYNGLSDEARNAVLVFTGTPANTCVVNVPSVNKTYVIANKTTGANAVVIQTTTSNTTNVSVANQVTAILYSDGTNVYSATTLNYINGNLTITGDLTVGGVNYSNGGINTNSGNLKLTSNTGIIAANASTGAFILPIGTDVQKPGSPTNGMIRYNTTLGYPEVYSNSTWLELVTRPEGAYTVNYLIVAGGGGGSNSGYNQVGGGGGAGGLVQSTYAVTATVTYAVVIGAGGASDTNGQTSSVFGYTGIGGGKGAYGAGGSGGSGGAPGGSCTLGQGNNGGGGQGGGGGAGAAGGNSSGGYGGSGGAGLGIVIGGSTNYYAGGGGGTVSIFSGGNGAGAGGIGGGAAGGWYSGPYAATPNTGGGGGASSWNGGTIPGSQGGSGIVIIWYAGAQRGTGGVVTTAGGYTIHTFNSSANYIG